MGRRRTNYNYRNIYRKHHGSIPMDENGRSFEIHHINGDHKDNRIENLVALSIEDHYKVHLEQGDAAACILIAKRIGVKPPDFSGVNNTFFGRKHKPESMIQMVETRRRSGNGDYRHGHKPGSTPEIRKANSNRMKTNNPMQVPGAAFAMQPKRVATLTSFEYWKSKQFDKLEDSKEIEKFIVNTPDATHLSLMKRFNLKPDFSKSIIRRFRQNGVEVAVKEVS